MAVLPEKIEIKCIDLQETQEVLQEAKTTILELQAQRDSWKQQAKDYEAMVDLLQQQLKDLRRQVNSNVLKNAGYVETALDLQQEMQMRHQEHNLDPNLDIPGEC